MSFNQKAAQANKMAIANLKLKRAMHGSNDRDDARLKKLEDSARAMREAADRLIHAANVTIAKRALPSALECDVEAPTPKIRR